MSKLPTPDQVLNNETKKTSALKIAVALFIVVLICIGAYFLLSKHNPYNKKKVFTEFDAIGNIIASSHVDYIGAAPINLVYFNEGIAVSTNNAVEILNLYDRLFLQFQTCAMKNPQIRASNDKTLVFDVGGDNFVVTDKTSIKHEQKWDNNIINARLNQNEYICILSDDSGYLSGVTVLNNKYKESYKWQSTEYYFIDADLSKDNKILALAAANAVDSKLCSYLIICKISSKNDRRVIAIGDEIIREVFFRDNNIYVLTSKAFYGYSQNGDKNFEKFFGENALKYTSFQSNEIFTLVFEDGAKTKLVNLDKNGNTLGETESNDDITFIKNNGKYVVVLSGLSIDLYNENLNLIRRTIDSEKTISVDVMEDGIVLSISGSGINFLKLK